MTIRRLRADRQLQKDFGFEPENVVAAAKAQIKRVGGS